MGRRLRDHVSFGWSGLQFVGSAELGAEPSRCGKRAWNNYELPINKYYSCDFLGTSVIQVLTWDIACARDMQRKLVPLGCQ